MKNLFTNLMKNTAKSFQNTGGGASQCQTSRSEGARQITARFESAQMKNTSLISGCSAVDVPMPSYGASDEHPMSTRSASDERRWNSRGWKYVACMLMVLVLGIGQMWATGTEVTFTANATSGKKGYVGSNDVDTLIRGQVTLKLDSLGSSTAVSQIYSSSSETKEAAWKLSSSATSNANQKYIELKAASGYNITGVQLRLAAGGSTTSRCIAVCFESAFSMANNSVLDTISIPLLSNANGNSASHTITLSGIPSGTGCIRIYKAVRYDGTNKKLLNSGGTTIWASSSAQTPVIPWIKVTYESAGGGGGGCSDPTAPTAFAKSSVTNTTATFSITDAADAASYDIYCSTSSTAPEGSTTPTATGLITKTPTITSLTANTTYYAWVRAVCDETHKSDWVALGSSSFTTLTTPTATFSNSTYAIGGSALDLSSLWTSDSDGAVTFSVDSAGTTGASVSTAAFSATTAGYAKVKAVQAATATKTAITKYAYIQVGSTEMGSHTITYNLKVNVNSTELQHCPSVIPTSLYLAPSKTIGTNGSGGPLSSGQSAQKIETQKFYIDASTSTYSSSNYVSYTFTVADGYTFEPTSVTVKFQSVSGLCNFHYELTDGVNTISKDFAATTSAGSTPEDVVWSGSGTTLSGTVTLKVFAYKQADEATAYRFGTPITITGTVAAETPACSAPTSPSVTSTNWIYVPGEEIELTASATGTDASTTYTWYKGATLETAKEAGAIQAAKTSAEGGTTYTISPCSASDAYRYWCVISNGTGCEASASYDIKIYKFYLYDNTGGDVSNTAFTTIDRTDNKISVDVALANAAYTYQFKVTDEMGTWYGKDETTITSGTAYADGLTSSGANVGLTSTGGGCDYTIEYYYNSNNVVVIYPASTYDITHSAATNGSYTIQIGSGAAVSTDTKSCDGSTITLAATPSSGYSLSSWSVTETDGGDAVGMATANTFIMPAKNVTVGASFACVTPTFGTNLSTSQVDYDKNASASALTVAATAGGGTVTYQWYSNDENNTDSPTTLTNCTTATYNPSTAATGTTYYYCVATNSTAGCSTTATSNIAKIVVSETSFTVTYNANGGSSAPSNDTGTDITLDDGSGMTGPSGYTFAGWNTNAKGTGTGYAGGTTSINANLDLFAIWKPTTACADGYSHVYSYYDSRRLVNGKRYNAIETTTWGAISAGTSLPYTAISGLTSVVLTKGCQAEDKIEAGYPWINSYIKVDKNSGTTTGAGITITVASGYIGKLKIRAGGFSGNASIWNNGTKVVDATSGNATSQNAFSEQTIDLVTGANLIQFDGNNAYVSHIDVKLIPLYTLTLDKNNSDASGSTSGSAYVEPNGTSFISGFTAPTRTGYDVEGYYGEAGCTTKIATAAGALQASKSVSEVEYTNSSSQWTKGSGATLYANWTPAVYSVTLDADGGTINSGNVTEYTFGVGATLPVAGDITAPSGAVFLGWYDGSTKVTSISTTATGNKSYKAKYGRTVYDSYFYQTYAKTSTNASTLIANAGFPSYITTNISNRVDGGTPGNESSITTPHDFSGTPFKGWYLKYGGSNNITISAVADVKAVHFYGWSASSRNISTTATLVSGTGSDLSISNVSVPASDPTQIKEYVVYISTTDGSSARSGYSNTNYYDYVFSSSGEWFLWGIYVEKYTNVPVTGVSLNKSSTTLTEGDTEQLTATIAPANATNKGLSWESSNTGVATVSSAGLITAKAAGKTTITVTTSGGSYKATCDVTVEAFSCAKFAGKIFELEVIATSNQSYSTSKTDEPEFNSSHVTVTDGHAYAAATSVSKTSRQHITASSSIGYIYLQNSSSVDWSAKLNLTKCALRNGDVISFTQKAGDSNQISITTSATRATTNSSTSGSYTVTPGDGLAGASTIYLWHASSRVALKTLTITRPTSYVMTYNPNGGRDEVDAERLAAGANTLTTDVPTRAGYVFKEWNTSEGGDGTGYAPGAAYTMGSADAELYAKWVTPTAGEMVYASVTMTAKNTATTVNGTGLVSNVGQSDDDDKSGYKLNSTSSCYFGITLTNGNFKENDKIVVDVVAKGATLDLCKATDGASFYQFTSLTNGTDYKGNNALQMTITADMVNPSGSVKLTNTIAIKRTETSPFNISHFIRSIKVYREICPGCMALKSGVTTWGTTASNWIGPDGTAAAMPGIDDVVYVDKNITVNSNAAKAKDVILGDGGSLTIEPTGGLVVAGTVTKSGGSATTPSDLVIESSDDGTGALITGEESTTTQAGVQFYTKARNDGGYVNQFIGVPLASMTTYNGFYGTALYVYDSTNDAWQLLGNNAAMEPFTAYNLMRRESTEGTLYMEGLLNLPGTGGKQELTITRRTSEVGSSRSDHLFANSWTAPIDIASMDEDDFDGADATIYIFNAGTKSDYDANHSDYENKKHDHPGQWLYMPVNAVKKSSGDFSLTVIPSMQAFMVHCAADNLSEAGGTTHTLTLDYKKHVYDPAKTSGATIVANRAPRREASEEDTKPEIVRIRVEGTNGYADDLLLFIGNDFSNGYDNGWEAYKVSGKAYTPQLYAVTEDGKKAISAQPDADNTVIGFKAGTEDDVYTFTLDYEGNDASLYLYDTYTDVYVRVEKDATYTFLTSDNEDHARFVLTSRNAPSVTTGVGNVPSDQVPSTKARKLMIDGILYIIREGRIYNAEGALVK